MRRLGYLFTPLLSIVVTCVVLEGALRLFWDDYYLRAPRGNLEFHPTRGWANKPNVRIQYGKPEYSVMVTHNSRGYRGEEVAERARPDRVRILVLGDSMAYGLGVEDDETFSAVLEQLEPRCEVINAAVPGYHTGQQLLQLREEGLGLLPDLVLVAFLWNDLEGSYMDTFVRSTLENGVLYGPKDHPALREKRVRHPRLSRSYLYRFVSDRMKMLRYRIEASMGAVTDLSLLKAEELEKAWELMYALLREIAATAEKAGAQPLLVIVPDQVQVEPDAPVIAVDSTLYGVQERLTEFGRRRGIPVLDLTPALRAAWERGERPLYFRFDRHFTPLGHRVAAEAILDWLKEHDAI